MTDTTETTLRPKATDREALALAIMIGSGVSVQTLVQAILRIVTIASNRDVPGSNGAASARADQSGANTPAHVDFLVIFAIASLGALSTAFIKGNRLQKDTEGLI